jgi:hypothetical protein
MGKCIASIAYTMKADIYVPTISQNSIGGAVKVWTLDDTIDCLVRGILRKGVGDNSVSVSLEDYINIFTTSLKMRSSMEIDSEYRIANVRNSEETIYLETQYPSSEGGLNGTTIFEPRGSTPLVGFDGRIIEYETVIVRQQIQKLAT